MLVYTANYYNLKASVTESMELFVDKILSENLGKLLIAWSCFPPCRYVGQERRWNGV
jgi:hypothetical protein